MLVDFVSLNPLKFGAFPFHKGRFPPPFQGTMWKSPFKSQLPDVGVLELISGKAFTAAFHADSTIHQSQTVAFVGLTINVFTSLPNSTHLRPFLPVPTFR